MRTYALPLAILVLAIATILGKRYSITGSESTVYRLDSFTGEIDLCRPRSLGGGRGYEVICGFPARGTSQAAPSESFSDSAYDAVVAQMHANYKRQQEQSAAAKGTTR